MKSLLLSMSALLFSSALFGCMGSLHAEAGSKATQSKTISQGNFRGIELRGSADMDVKVGTAQSIKVEGSQSRIDKLTTKIVDGVLIFDEESKFGLFSDHGDLKITITVPALESMALTGSGDITVDGIKEKAFSASISGSGDIALRGSAETSNLSVTGSGNLLAKGLQSSQTTVSIVGSGDIESSVAKGLTVSITGSGNLTYFGDPQITTSINGSGEANKG